MVARVIVDFPNLRRYRSANAGLQPATADQPRVVFLGDSITEGWELEKWFAGRGYINRGIGGQATQQMVLRFRQDVIELHPAVVVILAGTNDIAGHTGPMSLKQIGDNYATMAELAGVHGIRVIFSSILPVHYATRAAMRNFLLRRPKRIAALNDWLRRYCVDQELVYLDFFAAMVDERGRMRRELAPDGVHPNEEGYAVMAPLAQAAITMALAQPVSIGF